MDASSQIRNKAKANPARGSRARLAVLLAVATLAGCSALPTEQLAKDEDPVTRGSAARRNYTPLDPAFVCLANGIKQRNQPPLAIGVGDIKDYTGKYSQNEGSTITQGGALMVYSALGKLGNVVQLQERFDTRIAEMELAYTDKRQLGDGRTHQVEPGKPAVPWVPYFGGTILRSNYYIVGGITEVNYNVQSAGAEVSVNNVGIKRRTYTMNVGVDLRLVDTRSLVVVKTVSMQKQIKGHEVGGGIYRFFGTDLLDLNVGAKNQEPLQLGVRTTIEQGVLELIGAVSGVEANYCITRALEFRDGVEQPAQAALTPEERLMRAVFGEGQPGASDGYGPPAGAPAAAAAAPAAAPAARANGNGNGSRGAAVVDTATTQSGNAPLQTTTGAAGAAGVSQVLFEFGSPAISSQAMSQIEAMAVAANQGREVTFHVVGRDTEVFSPTQRRDLTNQRIKAVSDALASRGVNTSRIGITWLPEASDAGITRHGAGYQLLATLLISK